MRRAAVVKVQIARRELGIDEGAYRTLLQRVTGETSSTACTDAQLGRVLDELKAKGWKPKVVAGGRTGAVPVSNGRRTMAQSPMAKKARALWISLHQLGVVRDPSEKALESFGRRQLKVDRLQWADEGQAYRLIEALKAIAERAGWDQDTAGLEPDEAVAVLKLRLERLIQDARA